MNKELQNLLNEQLTSWEMAQKNYDALKRVRVKEVEVNGCLYKVQFNPARIVSSAAKVDSKSIQERKCFLCPDHLPPMQKGIPFGDHYQILVNPFPIFPSHLTVPELQHVDQRILYRFADMLDLADCAEDYIVFYNGPQCGASAPDHMHFQAGSKGFLPIEQEWKEKRAEKIITNEAATLWALDDSPRTTLLIESESHPVQRRIRSHESQIRRRGADDKCIGMERTRQTDCLYLSPRQTPPCMLYGPRGYQYTDQPGVSRYGWRFHHPIGEGL